MPVTGKVKRMSASPTHRSSNSRALWTWLGGFGLAVWIWVLFQQSLTSLSWNPAVFLSLGGLSRFGNIELSRLFFHWLSTLKNFGFLLGFWLAAYGIGTTFLESIFPAARSKLEAVYLALALGLAMLSLGTLGLGLLGGFKIWIYASLYTVLVFWGVWTVKTHWVRLQPGASWFRPQTLLLSEKVLIVVLAAVLVGEFFSANAPEIFFDSLVYHLGVPAQWIQHGGIVPLPTVFFSNLTFGIEMFYSGALLLSDERLCRILHVSLGVFAALGVFCLGRRYLGKRIAFWGMGIFFTIPLVVLNASIAGADVGSVAMSTAALLALANLSALEKPDMRSAWLVGLLFGAALMCKYTTAFVLVPAALSMLFWSRRNSWSSSDWLKLGWRLSLGTLLCLSPWFVKNTLFTGNPVYPFLYKIIPSQFVNPEKMQQQMDGFKEFEKRTWKQLLRLPWDLSFYYPTNNSYIGVVFLFLSPGVLMLAWTSRRGPPFQTFLLITACAGLLLWSTQTQIARYLMPLFPVLALLSAQVLETWSRSRKVIGWLTRWGVLLWVGWGVGSAAGTIVTNWNPLGVALGLQEKSDYFKQSLMFDYYPIAETINHLPGKVKVYIFGETRSYYFRKPITTVTVYDTNPFLEWLAQGPDAGAVWKKMREQGYTHLFVHNREAARTRGYESFVWTPAAIARYQEFTQRYCRKVKQQQADQVLYVILDTPLPETTYKTGKQLFMYPAEVIRNVMTHYDSGVAYAQANQSLDAQGEWQRIIQLVPHWYFPYTLLASQFQQQKQYAEAFQLYLQAEQLEELDAPTNNNLGLMFWNFGKLREAEQRLKLATEQDPQWKGVRKNLIMVQEALEKSKFRRTE